MCERNSRKCCFFYFVNELLTELRIKERASIVLCNPYFKLFPFFSIIIRFPSFNNGDRRPRHGLHGALLRKRD